MGPPKSQGLKRKHASLELDDSAAVQATITTLREAYNSRDKRAMRECVKRLATLATKKEDHVDTILKSGGMELLLSLLSLPPPAPTDAGWSDVEKETCITISALAIRSEYQQSLADAGVLPSLVGLLKRYPLPKDTTAERRPVDGAEDRPAPVYSAAAAVVARRAADAITNLAHENSDTKSRVRSEGGIPPLVDLLEAVDAKVQKAAAGALRTLAFKNEENKNMIVECGAVPTLVFMMRSADPTVHYEAVGVVGNLVHSSAHIKKRVLEEGALQPVIALLSSRCADSQREAALLIGQFATADAADFKARIVQRGAAAPLIAMLRARDPQLKEMAAFALGRLAQNADNQAGIVASGGLTPLLELMDAKATPNLQHNAAFALYGLADNEDNTAGIIAEGGVQRLLDGDLVVPPSRDCVTKTLKRLEDRIKGPVLRYLLHQLRAAPRVRRHRVAVALAHLCATADQRRVFVEHGALSVLLETVMSPEEAAAGDHTAPAGGGPTAAATPSRGCDDAVDMARLGLGHETARAGRGDVAESMAVDEGGGASGGDDASDMAGGDTAPEGGEDGSGRPLARGGATPAERAQREGLTALYRLAERAGGANALAIDGSEGGAGGEGGGKEGVSLPEVFVNSKTLSDVTFRVEGRPFYAHRIALLASSDAFKAMFDGGYREASSGSGRTSGLATDRPSSLSADRPAAEAEGGDGACPAGAIDIPNIRWPVFDAMMRCIYQGRVHVPPELAQELLQAADQYLLTGLKRLCEATLAAQLAADNVEDLFLLAEAYHAPNLAHAALLYVLQPENYGRVLEARGGVAGVAELAGRLQPTLTAYFGLICRPRAGDEVAEPAVPGNHG